MIKLTKIIDDFTVWIMSWVKWNAGILMLLISFEVIMRYAFNNPTIWGLDVQTMISGVGRILPVSYALLYRSHAVMDIFTNNLPIVKRRILDSVSYIFFYFPLIGSVTYTSYMRMLKSWKYKETMYTPWRPALYPMVTAIVISYVFLFFQGLSEFIKGIITIQKGSEEWLKDR